MSKNVSVSSWFFNQNFNGVADDFFDESLGFDDALKLFDFPLEPVEEKSVVENWDAEFKGLELPSPDALANLSSTFYSRGCSESKKLSASNENFKVKQERDVHESNSNCCSNKGQGSSCVFQSCSPDSVLERNMSAHPFPFDFKIVVPVKRRSKRPWNSGTRKEKKGNLSGAKEAITLQEREEEIRKCTHCEATQTPQWREGPMGPKTLCNACGVRYRSGRLFPEYRPLASPTFIESVHSNSHRKVAELRNRGTTTTTTTTTTRLAS